MSSSPPNGSEEQFAELRQRDARYSALMRNALSGDGKSYESLLREILPLLRSSIKRKRIFLQTADIENILQDVLLSLHAARATYNPDRPFLPWLMAITHHRMVDAARLYSRRNSHEVLVDQYPETFSDDEANMINDEYGDIEALKYALLKLPATQQQAVTLLKIREMSLKEASHHSGMSVAALKSSLHRAMLSLRGILEK